MSMLCGLYIRVWTPGWLSLPLSCLLFCAKQSVPRAEAKMEGWERTLCLADDASNSQCLGEEQGVSCSILYMILQRKLCKNRARKPDPGTEWGGGSLAMQPS